MEPGQWRDSASGPAAFPQPQRRGAAAPACAAAAATAINTALELKRRLNLYPQLSGYEM